MFVPTTTGIASGTADVLPSRNYSRQRLADVVLAFEQVNSTGNNKSANHHYCKLHTAFAESLDLYLLLPLMVAMVVAL